MHSKNRRDPESVETTLYTRASFSYLSSPLSLSPKLCLHLYYVQILQLTLLGILYSIFPMAIIFGYQKPFLRCLALGHSSSHSKCPQNRSTRCLKEQPLPCIAMSINPNTKQTQSRPPVGLREHLLGSPLPYYSGPCSLNMMNIEVPVRDPITFSQLKRHHRYLPELETVLFTVVFYPSGFGPGQGQSPEGDKIWSQGTWLPRPGIDVAKGYGKFAGIPGWPTIAGLVRSNDSCCANSRC